MSEPLTMSAERDTEMRLAAEDGFLDECIAELDAERAAHKRTQEALDAVRTCIGRVEIDIPPRDDTADWLAQVLQVLVSDESSAGIERDRALEQLRHSREVSTALLLACVALKEDYADSNGCYCSQIVQGRGEGGNRGICGYCISDAAIALAERDSNVTEESK